MKLLKIYTILLAVLIITSGCSNDKKKIFPKEPNGTNIPKAAQQAITKAKAGNEYNSEYAKIFLDKEFASTPQSDATISAKIDKAISNVEKFIPKEYQKPAGKYTVYVISGMPPYEALTYTASVSNEKVLILGADTPHKIPYTTAAAMACAKDQKEIWLRAGYGVFVNDIFGNEANFANYGADLDQLSAKILTNLPKFTERVAQKVGKDDYDHLTKEEWQVFYIMAGSFVKYIYKKVEKENFYKIYTSEDPITTIREITGRSIIDLKDDWIIYLRTL